MNERRRGWLVNALVGAVAVLATLLVAGSFRSEPRIAFAQSEGVSANYVIAMLGIPVSSDRTPLFVLDTKSQTIMVYEYLNSQRQLFLRAARSFQFDRELEDWAWGPQDAYKGPNVKDVQAILRAARPPAGGR